jgi:hypothetical protein
MAAAAQQLSAEGIPYSHSLVVITDLLTLLDECGAATRPRKNRRLGLGGAQESQRLGPSHQVEQAGCDTW